MNQEVLNHLANELLACYWDDSSASEVAAIAKKYGISMKSKIFDDAVEIVGKLCTDPGFAKENLSEDNYGRLLVKGVAAISKMTGAELGKDISFVNGGIMIDGDHLEKLMEGMTSDERAKFEGMAKQCNQDPFQMLEDSLGVPFFTKLEAIVKLRIANLSDVEASQYLAILIDGMKAKHPWLRGAWEQSIIWAATGDRFDAVFGSIDAAMDEDMDGIGSLVFDDLLMAMGVIDRVEVPEMGPVLSEDDLMALDKVFRGPEYSFAELAEVLRRKKFPS